MLPIRQLFLNHLSQTSTTPLMLEIASAEGVYMTTVEGNKILDLISGIGVSNVGHRHPKVLEAIKLQLDKYLHLMIYGELVQSPQVLAAKRLADTLPPPLDNVYFVNSGSEAIEGALKLAKRYTGRSEIIYFKNSYHGSSHGALSIMGNEYFKQAYRPLLPDTKMIHLNSYEDLNHITEATACVVLETIQGEAGVRIPEQDYMKALAAKCKATNTLLVLDEIQTGFGRTGTFWAFEHFGIVPDILVCAKGMGGGMPIGAFIASKAMMSSLTDHPVLGHITTFGGHPVSCAASLAVIDIIEEEKLLASIPAKEELFHQRLKHSKVKQIRSKGLMMAVEFESYPVLKKIIDHAIALGVLTDWFLHCDNAMRIAPPLTITTEQINEACDKILMAIEME